MINILRLTVAFVSVLVFLYQSFNKTIIYFDYQINKELITNMYCINKDRPEMQCNGKCHLKYKLAKDKNKGELPINPVKEKKEIQFFYLIKSDDKPLVSFVLANYTVYYLTSFSDKHLYSLYHPPIIYLR